MAAGLVELHCHAYGSIPAAKALERLVEVGPDLADFASRHHEAYGHVPDLKAVLEAQRRGEAQARERFEDIYVLKPDGGDRWARFQAKYNILTASSAFRKQPANGPLIQPVIDELSWLIDSLVETWQQQGLAHVECRFMPPARLSQGQARQCLLHLLDGCRRHSDSGFRLDLVVSVPRRQPDRHWPAIERVLLEHSRGEHLVGIDFCHREEEGAASRQDAFCRQLHAWNATHPERALALLIHVGEQLERGAIECHLRHVLQAHERGAHRLGHALIAGLDLQALGPHTRRIRREQALAQLDWEATHGFEASFERGAIAALPAQASLGISYDDTRLAACAQRQAGLLGRLRADGAIIESCPTSNRLMLDLPAGARRPLAGLLAARLNVAIASDDAGIFGCDLPGEWQRLGHSGCCDDASQESWRSRHQHWISTRLSRRSW